MYYKDKNIVMEIYNNVNMKKKEANYEFPR